MSLKIMKRCPTCGEEKPHAAFHRHRQRADGCSGLCKDCSNARRKTRYEATRQESNDRQREYNAANREKIRASVVRRYHEIRNAVLRAYGGDPPSCACCGETIHAFLTLDHVNGDGADHRRSVGNYWLWFQRNGYPPGFQVLCANCNTAKHKLGTCPHQTTHG